MFSRLMARLDGRIAVSEAARDTIGRYTVGALANFRGDYRLIPNGVDLARFGDSNRVSTPASCSKRKWAGSKSARGFSTCCGPLGASRLIVAGAFSRQQAEPFLRQVEVHFVGWLPDEKLARLYRAVDLVCVPSTGFESFGLVLLEAMAAGRPVVAPDIPGYREVVRDGREGVLVPPGNEQALAAALLRLVTDGHGPEWPSPSRVVCLGAGGSPGPGLLFRAYGAKGLIDYGIS